MVTEEERNELEETLLVRKKPLPGFPGRKPVKAPAFASPKKDPRTGLSEVDAG